MFDSSGSEADDAPVKQHDATQRAETTPKRADEIDAPPERGLLLLQSLVGNRAVNTKLEIGDVDSPHEREADEVARRVTDQAPADGGIDGIRGAVEAEVGADLSGARVHVGDEADEMSRAIGAKAFTTGSDVYFKAGAYDTESPAGRELIAHEFTHVAQQNPGVISRAPDDEEIDDNTSAASWASSEVDDNTSAASWAPSERDDDMVSMTATGAGQARMDRLRDRPLPDRPDESTSNASWSGSEDARDADLDSATSATSTTSNTSWDPEREPGKKMAAVNKYTRKGMKKGFEKGATSVVGKLVPGLGSAVEGAVDGLTGLGAERSRRKVAGLEPSTEAGSKQASYAASKKGNRRNKALERTGKHAVVGTGTGIAAASVATTVAVATTVLPLVLLVGAGAGLGIKMLRKGLSVWHRRGRSLKAFAKELAEGATSDSEARSRAAALGVTIEEGEHPTEEQVNQLYTELKSRFGSRRKYWASEIAGALDDDVESATYQDALELCRAIGVNTDRLLATAKQSGRVAMISAALESD